MKTSDKPVKPSGLQRVISKIISWWKYCSTGVWNDTRKTLGVRIIKILNLSVRSFMDRSLQIRSMALTYSTLLAIVPALALLVAIGRGFGLQDVLQNELYVLFPSQHKMFSTFMQFVDSYLTHSTQGLFVGVGIIVLLYTIISLLSSIEDAFNIIWDIKRERSFFRKFTDYITICLMVPVLLICSSGLSLFMTTVVQDVLYFPFLTTMVKVILDFAPLVLAWAAFTLSYFLIPNTKVGFKYAAISGAFAAIAFYILQFLFMNGQLYVSNYNAIYGSFAFLPLFLVWLQLTWIVLLIGCILTQSLQNVLTFNFIGDEQPLSITAYQKLGILVMSIIAQRFANKLPPLTRSDLSSKYNLPVRTVSRVVHQLKESKLIDYVMHDNDELALQPAQEVVDLTVADVVEKLDKLGNSQLSPEFDIKYKEFNTLINPLEEDTYKPLATIRILDIPLPLKIVKRN